MPATWEGLSKSLREILFLGLVGQTQVADKKMQLLSKGFAEATPPPPTFFGIK